MRVIDTRWPAAKFEGSLEAELLGAPHGRRFQVLVDLTRQVDYSELARRLLADPRPKSEKRAAVIRILEQVAQGQQASLTPELERWIREGLLDNYHSVAIVNRLVVEGSAPGILRLAERREVAQVRPEWTSRRGPGSGRSRAVPKLGETFTSWGIDALGARRLWEAGLDGTGVVVAAIDTGAFEGHEQLHGRRLGDGRGWFDPVQGSTEPFDNHGHGTSVLSLAVGGNPSGREIGVAPGARWAMALGNWQNHYSRIRMTLAADWMLRVARPDVLINAWSNDDGACNDFDLDFINAWKASGIFVVFPAGNAGPGPATGESPAQLPGAFPDQGSVFSVAALSPDGEVCADSSRGPSRCGSPAFPTVAAPGSELPFAHPPQRDTYGSGGHGTSFTAGLVGGGAALLLQAAPELMPWDLEQLLVETARDLPPSGRDDASGAGAVDLPAALAHLRDRPRSPPGVP